MSFGLVMLLAFTLLFANLNGTETPQIPAFPQTEMQKANGTPVVFPKSEDKQTAISPLIAKRTTPNNQIEQALHLKAQNLFDILRGDWDNDLQVFFEPEMGVAADKVHKRFHINLSAIESKEFGEFALLIEYFEGSEHGHVLRSRIWGINPDYTNSKIIVTQYEPKPGANYTIPKPTEFTILDGCELNFSSHVGGFTGEIDATKCKISTKQGQILTLGERHEIAKTGWNISDIAKNSAGVKVFGNIDIGPNEYKKANGFTCWASGFDGKEYKTKSDIKIHDQGGIANVKLGAKNIRLKLRDVVWPLGNNRPSLTLYLLLGKDDYSDIYAWTESDAKRIALAYGDYQASCTRD